MKDQLVALIKASDKVLDEIKCSPSNHSRLAVVELYLALREAKDCLKAVKFEQSPDCDEAMDTVMQKMWIT